MTEFTWDAFSDLAEELIQVPTTEARLRTAISRAYYFSYHVTFSAFSAEPWLAGLRHRHGIWESIRHRGAEVDDRTLQLIGDLAVDLKRRRERADYHLPFNRDDRRLQVRDEAAAAVNTAQELARMISRR